MYFIWNYIVIIFAYTCLKVETLEQQSNQSGFYRKQRSNYIELHEIEMFFLTNCDHPNYILISNKTHLNSIHLQGNYPLL